MSNSSRPDLTSKRGSKLPYLMPSISPHYCAIVVGEAPISLVPLPGRDRVGQLQYLYNFQSSYLTQQGWAKGSTTETVMRWAEAGAGQVLHRVNPCTSSHEEISEQQMQPRLPTGSIPGIPFPMSLLPTISTLVLWKACNLLLVVLSSVL